MTTIAGRQFSDLLCTRFNFRTKCSKLAVVHSYFPNGIIISFRNTVDTCTVIIVHPNAMRIFILAAMCHECVSCGSCTICCFMKCVFAVDSL